jgi:DnaK suppressor protein
MPRLSTRLKDNISVARRGGLSPSTKTRVWYRTLSLELKRQRDELLRDTIQELVHSGDATVLSDLLDQASIDQEQEFSLLVKQRIRDKLRQIDIALKRIKESRYGLCLRCQQEIPLARLKIQPSASYCVPCQALDESRRVMNKRSHGSAV